MHCPSPIADLYDFLHSTGDVTGDIYEFQTLLVSMSKQYICLESGVVDLVEHIRDSTIVKILDVMKGKGWLHIQELRKDFKEIASVDEIRVVAKSMKAFRQT